MVILDVLKFVNQFVIDDLLKRNPDNRILIFAHHKIMRIEIENCLSKRGISYFSLHGSVSNKKRIEFEDDFQTTDKYRVGVLSIYAA